MTHVVTSKCIGCKDMSCVTVCPVNCFYENEDMVVIDPENCIDCGLCVTVCPVNAIVADIEATVEDIVMNKKFSTEWQRCDMEKVLQEKGL